MMECRGGGGYGGMVLLLLIIAMAADERGSSVSAQSTVSCPNPWSRCFRKKVKCPRECPFPKPSNPSAKGCFLDCNSRTCEAVCKHRRPNCNGQGAGCYDPRFIGGDGVVFYFHGSKDEHFSLVSDPNFQINARFIGLRPAGRSRDFTWIQALSFLSSSSSSHTFTLEAAKAVRRWDDALDHLRFSYNGQPLDLPEGHMSSWTSPDGELAVERTGRANAVTVRLEGLAEASVKVVPVTEEDDRIHGYHVPADDCFAHLEVQFRFHKLAPEVEGVLGRTYQPDYVNPAKRGVAMPVLGGEDKYRTPSLVSPHCKACVFAPAHGTERSQVM
uniref:Phosphoheptose isomerase n=1 Tax=Anthurium amnicola TaxID=1678845 RepID=A0A1D1XS48_9ARAE